MSSSAPTARSLKKVFFEQNLGKRTTRAARERAEIMTRALPQIETYYDRLRRSERDSLGDVTADDAQEALEFYNAVVADGRYVDLLRQSPREVADKLGIRVSDDVVRAVERVAGRIDVGGPVEGPVEAVIAVAVVIVLAPKIPAGAEGVVIEENARVSVRL